MGGGVAAHPATLKRRSESLTVDANCSDSKAGDISDTTPRSRGTMRPRFSKIIRPEMRGRRECRVLAAPAVSCAKVWKERTRAYRYRRGHPDIPCAMALRLISGSPRRIRLVCLRRLRIEAFSARSGRQASEDLTPTMRRQDHTTSPYAAAPFVCALCSLTNRSPPCQHDHAPTLPRPPHPAPTFVTMANAPQWAGTTKSINLIWVCGEAEYFAKGAGLADRQTA